MVQQELLGEGFEPPCASDFTVSLRLRTSSPDAGLLSSFNRASLLFSEGFGLSLTPPGVACFENHESSAAGGLLFEMQTSSRDKLALCSSREVNDGEWHTVVIVVRRAGESQMFLDGDISAASRRSIPGVLRTTSADAAAEDRSGLPVEVSDALLHDRALLPEEVSQLTSSLLTDP